MNRIDQSSLAYDGIKYYFILWMLAGSVNSDCCWRANEIYNQFWAKAKFRRAIFNNGIYDGI